MHYLGWAFLQEAILKDPDGPTALRFWIAQVGSVLFVVGACLIGFRPALLVRASRDDDMLRLEQGTDRLSLSLDAIDQVAAIDTRRYHRHYRRYAATRVFAGRLPDTVVLLTTTDGPVVVSLASADENRDLLRILQTEHAPVAESTPAHS